jgi:hypothetical protein
VNYLKACFNLAMFGLSRRHFWLFGLLTVFVLQGLMSVHAASSGPGQKHSVSHIGHVHSHSAAAVDAQTAQAPTLAIVSWVLGGTVTHAGLDHECHTGGSCCPACVAVALDVQAYVPPVSSGTHFPELNFHHRSPTLGGLDRPPQRAS